MSDINKILNFREDLIGSGETIIVEGRNDKEQLSSFGINNIFEIAGNPLAVIVEKITKSRGVNSVTVLTDFDEEGRQKNTYLEKMLHHNGIKTNSQNRRKFKTLFKVSHIEDIKPFTKLINSQFMEESFNGKISSIYNKISNRSRILGRWSGRKA